MDDRPECSLLEFRLDEAQPYKTGLKSEGCPSFINTTYVIFHDNVGLNTFLHSQHNEDVVSCTEGNQNATIKQLGADYNEGGISNMHFHARAPMSLEIR